MTWLLPAVVTQLVIFHPREEEEDKMLEAMMRKKGEAHLVEGPVPTCERQPVLCLQPGNRRLSRPHSDGWS